MKLVEILARELEEWPEGVSNLVCSAKKELFGTSGGAPGFDERDKVLTWTILSGCGQSVKWKLHGGIFISKKPSDHTTAIVTRADWEAEKARIAGKETWLRHCGRKCPVQSGTLVDLKLRGGVIHRGKFCDNHAWIHTGKPFDVMYYRVSETDEQPAPVSEEAIQVGIDDADAGKLTPIVEVKARYTGSHAGILLGPQPIAWRDRIYELDTRRAELEATYQRQISDIAKERGELVGKLASEGLALVEAVQLVDPDFDAEDKSTWRVFDVVEIVSSDNRGWLTRKGMRGQLNYDSAMYSGGWYIKFDDAGDWCVSDNTELKFHSRNAS